MIIDVGFCTRNLLSLISLRLTVSLSISRCCGFGLSNRFILLSKISCMIVCFSVYMLTEQLFRAINPNTEKNDLLCRWPYWSTILFLQFKDMLYSADNEKKLLFIYSLKALWTSWTFKGLTKILLWRKRARQSTTELHSSWKCGQNSYWNIWYSLEPILTD